MTSVGITSYGYHLPWYRLSRKTISAALGALGKGGGVGDKAVSGYDEDSLSMAVNACIDCLKNTDRRVNGLIFATTTAPYRERESAGIIATALDLGSGLRTADFADSLKSGTSAIHFACDAVTAAGKGNYLVCGADCRVGSPGSAEEMTVGDGAAAVTIGNDDVVATFEGSHSLSYDFPDYRRLGKDRFLRSVEERFAREEGYSKIIPEAFKGFLKKYNMEPKDFAKIAFSCPNAREHATIAKKMAFQPDQVTPALASLTGDLGAASPLVNLVMVLEDAKPGDNILVVSYGNGAEVLYFKVTENISKVSNRGRFQKSLNNTQKLATYEKYLAFRGLLALPIFDDIEGVTELPLAWRSRKEIYALHGTKCKACGTPQYPPQRICVQCQAVDQMEDYAFADKKASLFSFTIDYASPNINPPLVYGYVDFEGGGRFVFELTDCEPGSIKTGIPVEMSFRRKYRDEIRGIVGYYWKAVPKRD